LNRLMKAKKGISPILATLLLIVIAVAAVIVTYAWVMTFTTTQTSQAGAIISEANTRFYNVSDGTKYIGVTLMNSGTADAKITAVYLGTSSANLEDVTASVTFAPLTKIVGANGGSIIATWSYNWASGQRYYFKFITEAGQQIPFDRIAP